jgi:antitoxin component of MazEF toxin-antitoxin module
MIKRLTKHGTSYALVIDRPLMDLLNIDDATPLSISTDGKCLIISPSDPARRKKFEQAKKDTFTKYRKTLKRLAE